MTKTEYTNSFVSENLNEENMDEKAVDVYGQLDEEVRIKVDYHTFRSAWKDYRGFLKVNLAEDAEFEAENS